MLERIIQLFNLSFPTVLPLSFTLYRELSFAIVFILFHRDCHRSTSFFLSFLFCYIQNLHWNELSIFLLHFFDSNFHRSSLFLCLSFFNFRISNRIKRHLIPRHCFEICYYNLINTRVFVMFRLAIEKMSPIPSGKCQVLHSLNDVCIVI